VKTITVSSCRIQSVCDISLQCGTANSRLPDSQPRASVVPLAWEGHRRSLISARRRRVSPLLAEVFLCLHTWHDRRICVSMLKLSCALHSPPPPFYFFSSLCLSIYPCHHLHPPLSPPSDFIRVRLPLPEENDWPRGPNFSGRRQLWLALGSRYKVFFFAPDAPYLASVSRLGDRTFARRPWASFSSLRDARCGGSSFYKLADLDYSFLVC
jgi:hypothetical protein